MHITEEIKRIKYLRMKPEERFLYDILTNVEFKYSDEYPVSIFLTLNDNILFEYNKKTTLLFVDYDEIWFILLKRYKLKEIDIQLIIYTMITDILKIKIIKYEYVLDNLYSNVWNKIKIN